MTSPRSRAMVTGFKATRLSDPNRRHARAAAVRKSGRWRGCSGWPQRVADQTAHWRTRRHQLSALVVHRELYERGA